MRPSSSASTSFVTKRQHLVAASAATALLAAVWFLTDKVGASLFTAGMSAAYLITALFL